ncbi:hypothetical protein FRB99_003006 [Tulasnella sp. 403]|nr:hypothetical protein FRB99_003006 [Tulasnella sp. 403]
MSSMPGAHHILNTSPNGTGHVPTPCPVTLSGTEPFRTAGSAIDLSSRRPQGITGVRKQSHIKVQDGLPDKDVQGAVAWHTLGHHNHAPKSIGAGSLDGRHQGGTNAPKAEPEGELMSQGRAELQVTLESPDPFSISGGFGDIFVGRDEHGNKVAAKRAKCTAGIEADTLRLRESADAIAYLHDQSILHGDIKASNVLVSDDAHALVCDFGLARAVDAVTSIVLRGAGSVRWQAPELWAKRPKSTKTDVYAFGMLIAEVEPLAQLHLRAS